MKKKKKPDAAKLAQKARDDAERMKQMGEATAATRQKPTNSAPNSQSDEDDTA